MHSSSLMRGLSLLAVFTVSVGQAHAVCSGAAAPAALGAFNQAPADWLADNKGKGDIGAKAEALSAAAVNANDSDFGKSLAAVLASASADDGAAIGSALGGLVNTCSDPKDPGDQADKRYITANIERNLLVNTAANTAYGQKGGPETAAASSTSGGGGAGGSSGSGTGTIGSGIPTGGVNDGVIADGSESTLNVARALASGSVPAIGPTAAANTSTSSLLQALDAAGESGTNPGFLLCYGSLNICGNETVSGTITASAFNGNNGGQSTTRVSGQ